jgi:hypothetical protein
MPPWDEATDDEGVTEDKLAHARDIMRGERPLMGDAPTTTVQLFRGVFVNGTWHDQAQVRELNGADEEGIARMLGASASAQFLNAMLAFGVQSIGTYDLEKMGVQERMGVIDQLLVGEKELLFLNVLRVTYGDQRTVTVQCQSCQAYNEVFFSLSEDVPLRKLDDPTRLYYDFETRAGSRLEYRLVNGLDAAEAEKRPTASQAEKNTIILSRVIHTADSKPLVDPIKFARELGAADRRDLMRELTSKQPGPYFEEVKLPCATCGAESLFTPAWADLL